MQSWALRIARVKTNHTRHIAGCVSPTVTALKIKRFSRRTASCIADWARRAVNHGRALLTARYGKAILYSRARLNWIQRKRKLHRGRNCFSFSRGVKPWLQGCWTLFRKWVFGYLVYDHRLRGAAAVSPFPAEPHQGGHITAPALKPLGPKPGLDS